MFIKFLNICKLGNANMVLINKKMQSFSKFYRSYCVSNKILLYNLGFQV